MKLISILLVALLLVINTSAFRVKTHTSGNFNELWKNGLRDYMNSGKGKH